MSEVGVSAVLVVAEGGICLPSSPSPQRRKKNPQIFHEKGFPWKLFLTRINFMYSDRGLAIESNEIIETARCGWRENIEAGGGSDCK